MNSKVAEEIKKVWILELVEKFKKVMVPCIVYWLKIANVEHNSSSKFCLNSLTCCKRYHSKSLSTGLCVEIRTATMTCFNRRCI